jgi:hypothetical protein
MSVLFHFIFSLVKIAALATIYSTLILLTARLISRLGPNSPIDKLTRDKFKFWKSTSYVLAVGLFIYSFTYWGDHGLGDSSLIPVGHGQSIHNGDASFTYFYTSDNEQRHIYNYAIKSGLVCAEQDDNRYLIYNLETKELKEFNSMKEYEDYAKANELPTTSEFKDFIEHYEDYWNGWRGRFLP